jgi:dTDP-4-amino-4,6-dideoxygalactose transaminase
MNSRLDTLQAAILLVKLKYLDKWTERRRLNATIYRELMSGADAIMPKEHNGRHVYNQFTVRSANRDEMKQALAAAGVGTEVYYPIPLHLQECFRELGYGAGDFPESERAAKEVLSLPIEEGLPGAEIAVIAGTVRSVMPGVPVC